MHFVSFCLGFCLGVEDVGYVHHMAEYRAVLVGIDFLIASQKLS